MNSTNHSTLILLTLSYPYDSASELTFIESELSCLVNHFNKVIIFPLSTEGLIYPYSSKVVIDTRLANKIAKSNNLLGVLYAFKTRLFFKEILRKPNVFFHFQSLKESIAFLWFANITYKWLFDYIFSNNIDVNNTLFYSFWLNFSTFALGSLKKNIFRNIQIVY